MNVGDHAYLQSPRLPDGAKQQPYWRVCLYAAVSAGSGIQQAAGRDFPRCLDRAESQEGLVTVKSNHLNSGRFTARIANRLTMQQMLGLLSADAECWKMCHQRI